MKISIFKIGILLVIIGSIWISMIFTEVEKIQNEVFLKQTDSYESKLVLTGVDIGFYKIYMPEFLGEQVFIQILDIRDNVIEEQMIQTKMSVGYFDFKETGEYTLRITNISKNPVIIHTEFGITDSEKMIPGGILLLVGGITILGMSYIKLKNYNIAQPDENIS